MFFSSWDCLAITMKYWLLLKELINILSVYEHLGLSVQKVSWLPCQNMEFIDLILFFCETNLGQSRLTALYLEICMKAYLGILGQIVTELSFEAYAKSYLSSIQEWGKSIQWAAYVEGVVQMSFICSVFHQCRGSGVFSSSVSCYWWEMSAFDSRKLVCSLCSKTHGNSAESFSSSCKDLQS